MPEAARNIMMTVASLAPETGGPARSVSALSASVASPAWRVDLCSLAIQQLGAPILPSSPWVQTRFSDCHYSRCARLLWAPNHRRALARRAQESSAQLLHDNGLWLHSNHAAVSICRRLNLPLVISPRGMISPWALRHQSLKKSLAWRLYQKRDLQSAALLHATSLEEAGHLRAIGLKQPIAVIPNGVDLPSLDSGAEIGPAAARTVLFLGRLHSSKGLLNLIEAWSMIRPEGWQVVLAGPDEAGHRAELEAALRARGLENRFRFIGQVGDSEKWDIYRNAALFVLPTFTENFGLSVAEALGSGLPVITTKGAPWADLESHGCGWWVDIGAEPLAAALRSALALSPQARVEMGARGRRLVQEKYSWPIVGAEMRQVYHWLVQGGAPPKCMQFA